MLITKEGTAKLIHNHAQVISGSSTKLNFLFFAVAVCMLNYKIF